MSARGLPTWPSKILADELAVSKIQICLQDLDVEPGTLVVDPVRWRWLILLGTYYGPLACAFCGEPSTLLDLGASMPGKSWLCQTRPSLANAWPCQVCEHLTLSLPDCTILWHRWVAHQYGPFCHCGSRTSVSKMVSSFKEY